MEYTVYATFKDVQAFHIEADSPEEAKEKVLSGTYDPYETVSSEVEDIEVDSRPPDPLTQRITELDVKLGELIKEAEQRALADVMGCSEPFSAVAWRKTLPKEVQPIIEETIVRVYHNT